MKYRRFGRLDWQVSALGFGAMRLPVIDKDQSKINEPEAMKMIQYAFDNGVNYIDTAYPYHGGTSEGLVGRVLKNGYRDKVKLATKMPSWVIQTADDFDKYLNEQFCRLQVDHVDFYLLHGLNKERWPKLRDLEVLSWAEKAISDDRIGHLGFSFHDEYEVFEEIVDAYDKWALCQIQYNYMDTEYQAGTKGLKYAAEKGLAVVIMEPIRGGQLAKKPPEGVAKLWDSASDSRSPSEWALQWVWNQPEVSTVLSGMSKMDHVIENVAAADRSGSNTLTGDELSLITRVQEEFRKRSSIPCTDCKYCMPCPNNVNIPGIFGLYNDAMIYGDVARVKFLYGIRIPEDERAEHCEECKECEELCPQEIDISEWLKKADELLGQHG
ncbi:MAG: aldo/keto reductase [Deltaproteobacteria bacterium]|nr:aldo/keto reductase [Deltaproteobacteria bacterium]MBW2052245.1 aldo/keto reductase [Deltaproteobacteria bacterium]MBW2141697.1 aldo/keto reductase [Deltaproteobacteria bacterium]MBW2322048.1 aldo/keto reductase [Deltaproteobacteria bacterium]